MRRRAHGLNKRTLAVPILIVAISGGFAATLYTIQNGAFSSTPITSETLSQAEAAARPNSGSDEFALPGGIPLSARLQQKTPFAVLIMGDYGNKPTPDDWIYKFTDHINDTYNRMSIVHYWSTETSSYTNQISIGDPALPLTEIWVGSDAKLHAAEAASQFQLLAPQRPDIAIVNFGFHEEGYPQARQSFETLEGLIKTNWVNPPAMAVVLQNPRVDRRELTTRQFKITSALRTQYGAPRNDVRIIDIFEAFLKTTGTADLVDPNGYTPNQRGNDLWAETVQEALGIPN